MSKTLPTISVILPVYNSGKMIEKAILSVIDQQYPSVELIVIDGGSTDGTVDVIKRYEAHIAYWHSKRDGSCGLAINLGLQRATGDLTIQLMADDWFEPGIFHAVAKAYQANPDADIISCGGRIVSYDEKTKTLVTRLSYQGAPRMNLDLKRMCFDIPGMSSRYIARKYVQKIGLLNPFDSNNRHNYSADREYLIRAAVIGCKNIVIDKLGHTYFAHTDSATFGKNILNQFKIFEEHLALVDTYLKTYPLTQSQKIILIQWYCDQSVRYTAHLLLNKDIKKACHVAKQGLQKYLFAWLLSCCVLPFAVGKKKVLNHYMASGI